MPRLCANNVTVSRGGRTLLENASLEVQAGELIGLIGPNGAGKSTFLSLLAGLAIPDSGTVTFDQIPLVNMTARSRARNLGWLEQLGSVHWPISVERLVTLGRLPHLQSWQSPQATDHAAVEQALADTDCLAIRHRQSTTLSGGELARVLLARALASQPAILLADEPVSSLDLGHQLQTMDLMRNFADGDRAGVVVLHDLSLAARYCDRLYLLHDGKMAAAGSVASVLSNENLRQVYAVDVIAGCNDVPWIIPLRRIDSN